MATKYVTPRFKIELWEGEIPPMPAELLDAIDDLYATAKMSVESDPGVQKAIEQHYYGRRHRVEAAIVDEIGRIVDRDFDRSITKVTGVASRYNIFTKVALRIMDDITIAKAGDGQ